MEKKRVFILVFLIILVFSSFNLYMYFNNGMFSYDSLYSTLSGRVVDMPKISSSINFSLIAFIIQWIVLLLIIFISYFKYIKRKKIGEVNLHYSQIKQTNNKSSTDLDVFYELLKKNKRLRINVVSKTFNISNDKAVEWARILENYGLAKVEFPAFSDPEITLIDKDTENISIIKKEIEKENIKPEADEKDKLKIARDNKNKTGKIKNKITQQKPKNKKTKKRFYFFKKLFSRKGKLKINKNNKIGVNKVEEKGKKYKKSKKTRRK